MTKEYVYLKMNMFRPIKNFSFNTIYESNDAIFAYVCFASLLTKPDILIEEVSAADLFHNIEPSREPTPKEIQSIRNGIHILEEEGLIIIEKEGYKFSFCAPCLYIDFQIPYDSEGINIYFIVPIEYIQKLLSLKNGISLVHHYLLLCSTINLSGYGKWSQENFAKFLNKNIKTISRRHKAFEDMSIIVFSDAKSGVDEKGNFYNKPKFYCMPYSKEAQDITKAREASLLTKLKNTKKKRKKNREIAPSIIQYDSSPSKTNNPFERRNPFGA